MKPPRYQLTLHQLMVLVAFCALSFALLATAAAPMIVAIWIVLPGIAIDRARGGEGVVGGILAGGFAAVAFIWFFGYFIDDRPTRRADPFLLIFPSLLFLPFGVIFGAVVNDLVRLVPGLLKRTRSSTDEGRTGRTTGIVILGIRSRGGSNASPSPSLADLSRTSPSAPSRSSNRHATGARPRLPPPTRTSPSPSPAG
jgi:hypothetical protein